MIRKKIKVIDVLLLILVSFVLLMYFIFNMPHSELHILRIALDDQIPRLPIFTIPYLFFIPWSWGVLIYSWYNGHSFHQLAYSFIIINLVAFLIYLTFQTYVPRDPITSHDLFSNTLQFIYNHDQPYSGFPSLHSALSASIATYFVCRRSKLSLMAILIAVLIVVSTLFVKQHFVLDAVSGVSLGIIATLIVFRLSNKSRLLKIEE